MASKVLSGHVLLGGGTGFVGSALRHLLKDKGYEVTVISRMPGARRVTWFDICSSGLPNGVTAVVNLAGQNVLDPRQRWTPGFKQNVWNSRINTTFTLSKAIANAKIKPKVFVTISGVGIYRPGSLECYDEYSEVGQSFDFLSKLASEWEKAAELPPEVGVRSVIIRSGVVLGRQGGMIRSMFLPFFFGLGGPIASGQQPLPWIHLKDLCNLFLFAIENDQVKGVLNGVAPDIVTNEEFTKAFAKAMYRPAFFRVPEFILNLLFSSERAKIMTMGQKVKPAKVKKLGFNYEFPTVEQAVRDCSRIFYSHRMPSRTAGVIVIGDEVLKGQVADSNIPFLAKKLYSLGIKLCRVSVIPDDVEVIAKEVAELSSLYDQVITSGGIGPTHDDVTYEGVGAAFEQPMVVNQELVTYWSWFNGDPPGNTRRESTVKMATIPRNAILQYAHLPNNLVPEKKFPVVTVNNVCVLPGLPKYLRAIFNALEGTYFKCSGLKFNVRRIYLSVYESVFAEYLNEAVKKFGDIAFGSYPKLGNPYYKTVVTMECSDLGVLEEAHWFLTSKLNKDWLVEQGELLGDCWVRTKELIDSDEVTTSSLTTHLKRSIEVLDKCLDEYRPSEIFISFNGGKDCTVLVHLVHSLMLKRYNHTTIPNLNAVYIRTEDPFPDVEEFIYETANRYNLRLTTEEGPLQKGIQNVVKHKPEFKAAILGTRRCDPCGAGLSHIQKTDKGWGNLIRVSPLLEWSYQDIWSYLKELNVPYCKLYDMGYTSLDGVKNSKPNPALEYIDEDGTKKYKPAYSLEDDTMERVGRQ